MPTPNHEQQESQASHVTAVLPPQISTIVEPPAAEPDLRPSTPTLAPTAAAEQVAEQTDNTTTPSEVLQPPVLIPEPIAISPENLTYGELLAECQTEIQGLRASIATLQQQLEQAQEAPLP